MINLTSALKAFADVIRELNSTPDWKFILIFVLLTTTAVLYAMPDILTAMPPNTV